MMFTEDVSRDEHDNSCKEKIIMTQMSLVHLW